MVDDDWRDYGDKGDEKTDNDEIGESDGQFAAFARDDVGEFVDEWRERDGEKEGGAENEEAGHSLKEDEAGGSKT